MSGMGEVGVVRTGDGSRSVSFVVLGLVAVLVLVALDTLAGGMAREEALSRVRLGAQAAAELRVAMLRSEIEKYRSLPQVLAADPGVRAALETPGDGALLSLNERLDHLAQETRAAAIYVIDRQGLTRAASNFRTAESFVGNTYAFRPYFTRAMAGGSGEHFAFGTVSRRPGLYLSRRIEGADGPLGVVVVKAEFAATQAQWHSFAEPTYVTDARGIVLLASEPAWPFHATTPLDADQRASIRASLQFGDAPLDLLPLGPAPDLAGAVEVDAPVALARMAFMPGDAPLPELGWVLHVLAPVDPSLTLAMTAARSLALLGGLAGLGLLALWMARRAHLKAERVQQQVARRDLELRVAERTSALREANARLTCEIEERRRTQAALNQLHDELVQANKLALLGQIAASLAHEVNQPVAAIRTYSENARAFLDRGDAGAVHGNLATIEDLTVRVGAITGEFRSFARKTPKTVEPVSLRAVIEGASLLVRHRLRQQNISLTVEMPDADLRIAAARVRLEQVLVNLLQNAVEALQDHPAPQIEIRATSDAATATAVVTVRDNGPGLSDLVRETLFMPFVTTKPEGVGLGLVIARDIVVDFGGTFVVEPGPGGVFTMTLPRI